MNRKSGEDSEESLHMLVNTASGHIEGIQRTIGGQGGREMRPAGKGGLVQMEVAQSAGIAAHTTNREISEGVCP